MMLTMVALSASLVTPVATSAGARACLSPNETRESVASHQLREPMVLLRDVARETRAEPLKTRLCLWDEKYVYEMSLLRRDGRVLRVFVDASSGTKLAPRDKQER